MYMVIRTWAGLLVAHHNILRSWRVRANGPSPSNGCKSQFCIICSHLEALDATDLGSHANSLFRTGLCLFLSFGRSPTVDMFSLCLTNHLSRLSIPDALLLWS